MSKLKAYHIRGSAEAGCDEAGRGCLAGPVVAAAVILSPRKKIDGLNDSKQLSAKQRDHLRSLIEKKADAWAVGVVSPQEIDQINILNASFLAMHRAIEQLSIQPEVLLIDGNRFKPFGEIPHYCMIKGDARFRTIAAASVLAKTHRDELMVELHHQFPQYHWLQNMGYPTPAHRKAIHEHGITPHHRKTFRVSDPQLRLKL